ncbi:MAG TPA: hypothetical protein VD998_04015 [Verrucomicrobiae bacterium]|nr:hypothetical protein [Verrucomicrobiae bacterium]
MDVFLLAWACLSTLAFLWLAIWVFFRDRGSFIYPCPSNEARMAVISALHQYTNVKPVMRRNTGFARRAMMSNGTIINHTTPEGYARLGAPSAGYGVVVEDPVFTATQVAYYLRTRGFKANILPEDTEPDAPKGSLIFLQSDAFGGWVMVFRKHFTKMGGKPPAWNWDDELEFLRGMKKPH